MPIRHTRPRKETGLRKYIVLLYTRPVYKFLYDPELEPIKDLIYGPSTSFPSRKLIEQREGLWRELREDILAAQAEYAPNQKPWGCRFDRNR